MEQEFDGKCQVLSEKQGKKLRRQVCVKLVKLYEAEELVVYNEVFGHNLVWACQKVELDDTGKTLKLPPWYMIRGIADFFFHCSLDLKKSMQRMGRFIGFHRLAGEPKEKQDRYDKVYADMAREVLLMSSKFGNTSMQKKALGLVHDITIPGGGMVLIGDIDERAWIIGSEEATACKYIPKQLEFESRDWRFSI